VEPRTPQKLSLATSLAIFWGNSAIAPFDRFTLCLAGNPSSTQG
jgi:hypothetical protein